MLISLLKKESKDELKRKLENSLVEFNTKKTVDWGHYKS